MAARMIFFGSEKSKMTDYKLEVFAKADNEIFISIESPNYEGSFVSFDSDGYIALDVDTAIKFSKQLRKSIAEVKEVDNV